LTTITNTTKACAERKGIERRELAVTCPACTGGTWRHCSQTNGTEPSGALKSSLAGYGSDDDSGRVSETSYDSAEDEDARKIHDQVRQDKRREREREMRMSNMGPEQRAKQLARQQNCNISERVTLGFRLAKPNQSKESMLDSNLFNQESLSGNFAEDDAYNLYDRPLFHGSTASAAIYKARVEGNGIHLVVVLRKGLAQFWIMIG
jgi:hypothetical protein